jgi:hypothetical protein
LGTSVSPCAEGTTLWAVRGGGTGSVQLNGVAVHGAGGVVAAGHFSNSATFYGSMATFGVRRCRLNLSNPH